MYYIYIYMYIYVYVCIETVLCPWQGCMCFEEQPTSYLFLPFHTVPIRVFNIELVLSIYMK